MSDPLSPLSAEEILDGLELAVVAVDEQLRVQQVNLAAEVVFGVSARLVQGQALLDALPILGSLMSRIEQALHDGEAFTERDLRLDRRQNGAAMTVDLAVSPLRLNNQRCLLLEISRKDRHLRISRDDQLWQQQQLSQEMIRGLAHEVKNPLGGLRGAAQLLARELSDDGQREFTDIIIREADRLQALVDRLLGPNRLPQKRLVNIHEVVEHVRVLATAQAPQGVVIERDYDPSLPDVEADSQQLIQALLNIVVNALDALSESGKLTLRTRSQRQFTIGRHRHRLVLRVDVVDNGPGIAPDMLESIFYPMVTTRPEGSGLGLAIAQQLCRNHGGLIECESQPGQTMFSLYLPVGPANGT